MTRKQTYEDLEKQIVQLKKELVQCKQTTEAPTEKGNRYRNIFKTAPVPLIELNFNVLKETLIKLGIKSGNDFRRYLNEHPEFLQEAKQMFEIMNVNDAALRLLQAERTENVLGPISRIFSLESDAAFFEALVAFTEGNVFFEIETMYRTLQGELKNIMLTLAYPSEKEASDNMLSGAIDITHMKRMEGQLRTAHDELEKRVMERTEELVDANEQLKLQSRRLEEFNAALKVLLQSRENDKKELEEKILLNMKNLVFPYVNKLKIARLDADHLTYVEIVENNLHEIISPFSINLSSKYIALTPKEIQVAGLIRDGMTTKEIADILVAGKKTVEFHRTNIRKKLGLKNKKVNLRSYLQSISKP